MKSLGRNRRAIQNLRRGKSKTEGAVGTLGSSILPGALGVLHEEDKSLVFSSGNALPVKGVASVPSVGSNVDLAGGSNCGMTTDRESLMPPNEF